MLAHYLRVLTSPPTSGGAPGTRSSWTRATTTSTSTAGRAWALRPATTRVGCPSLGSAVFPPSPRLRRTGGLRRFVRQLADWTKVFDLWFFPPSLKLRRTGRSTMMSLFSERRRDAMSRRRFTFLLLTHLKSTI